MSDAAVYEIRRLTEELITTIGASCRESLGFCRLKTVSCNDIRYAWKKAVIPENQRGSARL